MSTEPKDQPERDKAIADRVIGQMDLAQKFAEQELATHARWLTASLFAANSAGIIAVVNGKLGASGMLPALIFVVGIGAALLSGYALQLIYGGHTSYLSEAGKYWFFVQIGDARDAEAESALSVALRRVNYWNWTAPLLGWVSGLLFLGGAIVTGLAMLHAAHC